MILQWNLLFGCVVGAASVLTWLMFWRRRSFVFDAMLTPRDRRVIGLIVVFWCVPTLCWVAPAMQWLFATLWRLPIHKVHFWGLYAELRSPEQALQALPVWQQAWLPYSGLLALVIVALALILWTVQQPANAAFNLLRFELGHVLLWVSMLVMPAVSLALQEGPMWTMHQALSRQWVWLGDVALFLHGCVALVLIYQWRYRVGPQHLWLATPMHDRLRALQRRYAQRPQDWVTARELGRLYLNVNNAEQAYPCLTQALQHLDAQDAQVSAKEKAGLRLLLGVSALQCDQPQEASQHLRDAGQILEETHNPRSDADLHFEILLALSSARLELGDHSAALQTAELAHYERPGDVRATLVKADALIAADRKKEAKDDLERIFKKAEGLLATEVRQRLKGLS